MQVSAQKLKKLCRKRGWLLKDLLAKAQVSRTAFYSLLRKESVLPRSIHSLADALALPPAAFLEDTTRKVRKIERLQKVLESVMQKHPQANRENVWHALLLLEEKPVERLRRGLIRGQKFDFYR